MPRSRLFTHNSQLSRLRLCRVAVVDSGINLAHGHFANTTITTYNATDGLNASAFDGCLHGTGMAGIVRVVEL